MRRRHFGANSSPPTSVIAARLLLELLGKLTMRQLAESWICVTSVQRCCLRLYVSGALAEYASL